MTWWEKKSFIGAVNAYDSISEREQRIVLSAMAIILALVGYLLLIEPLLLSNKALFDKKTNIEQGNLSLNTQIVKTKERQFQNPNDPLRDELEQLEKNSSEMQEKISLLTQALVAPKEMVSLLEKILLQDKQLKLLSLRNLPEQAMNVHNNSVKEPSNIVEINAPSELMLDAEEALIYKHGFEIELEATYGSTVEYLKRLDALPWQLF